MVDRVMDTLNQLWAALANPHHLIIVGLLALGYVLRSNDSFPNRWIVYAISLAGIAASLALLTEIDFASRFIRGVIYSAISCLLYESFFKFVQNKIDQWFGNKSGLLAALLIPCIFLTGCFSTVDGTTASSTGSTGATSATTNAAIQSGAQVTAYGFTCWALSLSKGDDADLAEKKAILAKVVLGLQTYQSQGASAASVVTGLTAMLPDFEHWKIFKDALGGTLTVLSGEAVKGAMTGLIAGIQAAVTAY